MSYILDALRRAEAERDRERGQVPGLNAQPVAGAAADDDQARLPLARWAGVALLTLAAVLALWWGSRDKTPAPAPAVAVNPPGVAGVGAAGGTGTEAPVDPPGTSVAVPAVADAPPAAAPAAMPLPIVVSAPPAPPPTVVSAPPAPVTTRPTTMPPAAPTAAAPVQPAAAVGTEAKPLALSALSAEQRRDWPPLALGGGVYSDSPGSRFVIIGGQLVREGDGAAPGVVVERIGPRSVVMRWRDLRVELPY